ncbi:MAG: hypothetical protein ACM3Q2_00215 [Syntrophothermus sp.]
MTIKNLFFVLLTSTLLALPVMAQEEETDSTGCDKGNESVFDEEDWDWNWDWNFRQGHAGYSFSGQPTIEALYGVSAIGVKSLNGKFADAGAAELRLSYSTLRERGYGIAVYKNNFVFLSNNNLDLKEQSKAGNLNSEAWRFGIGWQRAFAYTIGSAAIIPYNSNQIVWTRFKVQDSLGTVRNAADRNVLKEFDETFRFGTSAEAGIKVQIVPVLTFNAAYERAAIFPRHLFWKQAGSWIIEMAGQGVLEQFAKEVMHSSPAAGPIVNFLLKSGLSYAVYELRKEKMNWPFDSAEPLTFDTWKVGMTFTF